jgi:hypothetical protein
MRCRFPGAHSGSAKSIDAFSRRRQLAGAFAIGLAIVWRTVLAVLVARQKPGWKAAGIVFVLGCRPPSERSDERALFDVEFWQ